MFVVTLTYRTPLAEVEVHIPAHRDFLDRHYASGVFLASGPRNPRVGGVILVSRQVSRQALDALLAEDPFHQHGVAEYEVTEFVPNKLAPALAGIL